MKKGWAVWLAVALLMAGIGGCTKADNGESNEPVLSAEDWRFYNERAEAFVGAMGSGDFNAAVALFDPTMKKALSVAALESDVWHAVIARAGAFVAVHAIENLFTEGYYICFTTTQHETSGVTFRIVFSKEGLVAGLFVDGYPTLTAATIQQHENFTDYPVILGEGTDYPLGGILSVPDGVTGTVPAVVLVHGSGPQDRDETIYENKPFRDIAEYLAANGIAVIRYDKRTFVHGTKLAQQFGGSLTVKEETIEDALLAAALLQADPRIDADKVFIIGHSLGGMLAPRIAEGGHFAGIISLAGSPRSLLDISYDQSIALIEETMTGDEKVAALRQMETEGRAAIDDIRTMPDDEAKQLSMGSGVYAYYYKEMDEHPVSAYVTDMQMPWLIMQGEKDFQVYADTDYAQWQTLLAGRTNVTFKLYAGLNHLFMPSAGKSIAEYQAEYQVAGQVDHQVLLDMVAWIKAH